MLATNFAVVRVFISRQDITTLELFQCKTVENTANKAYYEYYIVKNKFKKFLKE